MLPLSWQETQKPSLNLLAWLGSGRVSQLGHAASSVSGIAQAESRERASLPGTVPGRQVGHNHPVCRKFRCRPKSWYCSARGWAPVYLISKLDTALYASYGPVFEAPNAADWISKGLLYPSSERTKDRQEWGSLGMMRMGEARDDSQCLGIYLIGRRLIYILPSLLVLNLVVYQLKRMS